MGIKSLRVSDQIIERVKQTGERFVLEKNAGLNPTVRSISEEMYYSKSTVHKDITERLPKIDQKLYDEVRAILDENKSDCHIRGGEATKRKYLSLRNTK